MSQPEQAEISQDDWDAVAHERDQGFEAPVETPAPQEPADQLALEQTGAKEDEAGQQAQQPAAEQEDPLAGLPQAVRDKLQRLDQLIEEQQTLKRHIGSAEGRVAAMQRELALSKNAAKAVDTAPNGTQIAAAQASPQAWESLKSDFPEWAEATEALLNARLAGITPAQTDSLTLQQVNELVAQRVTETRQEVLRTVEEAKIEGKYEDWRDTVKSDEFAKWFSAQDPSFQALANSERGRDVIDVLDKFAQAKAAPVTDIKAGRANKLAAAATTKPGLSEPVKAPEQMTPDELWDYEAKQAQKRHKAQGLY